LFYFVLGTDVALPFADKVSATTHNAAQAQTLHSRTRSNPLAGRCSGQFYAGLEFTVVPTLREFELLEREWDELITSSGHRHHVFQYRNWLHHWSWIFLGRLEELTIETGRRKGLLEMIWPLVRERRLGCRVLK
jgi:hypothetical protein